MSALEWRRKQPAERRELWPKKDRPESPEKSPAPNTEGVDSKDAPTYTDEQFAQEREEALGRLRQMSEKTSQRLGEIGNEMERETRSALDALKKKPE